MLKKTVKVRAQEWHDALVPGGHRTMADIATERLHDAIITGRFPPGTPLRLIDISERLGMSSMPVREALRRLESIGLVTVLPHRGAYVREMTLDDFEDTMATRRLLECECVERAARAFAGDRVEKCRVHLDRYVALMDAGLMVEARTAHRDFHYAIYEAAGSRWLLHAIDTVWKNSERYRFAAEPASSRDQTIEEHTAILEACAARDPVTARQALADHLDRAATRMRANLVNRGWVTAELAKGAGATEAGTAEGAVGAEAAP